jgi:hypothetical protein
MENLRPAKNFLILVFISLVLLRFSAMAAQRADSGAGTIGQVAKDNKPLICRDGHIV